MNNVNYHLERETLLASSSPQDLTNAWADLGSEIMTLGYNSLGVWLTIDINSSANVRLRALAKLDKSGTNEYSLPIKTVGSSSVLIEQEYYEFNVDEDAKYLLEIELNNHVPFVQLQVYAGTVGATAGQIDECIITKVNK